MTLSVVVSQARVAGVVVAGEKPKQHWTFGQLETATTRQQAGL